MIGFSDIILEDIKKKYSNYDTLWQVKDLLDMAFYEGRLKYGFDTDIKELSFHSEVVRQCFALSRETLLDWFWLGVENQVLEVMDKVTLRLIKNTIAEGSIFRAQHQFNVRWTLLNYLDETRKVGENMSQLRKELREHINMEDGMDWEFSSDEEFSYAVGQAVSYLFSLSKAKDKDESIINSFLNTCSVKILKSKLRQLYQKYNYGIQHDSRGRFGRMAAEIMEYEPKEINSELLMAGFVSASLIYEKKNK
jgi:CRISPR-associated protein Csh1